MKLVIILMAILFNVGVSVGQKPSLHISIENKRVERSHSPHMPGNSLVIDFRALNDSDKPIGIFGTNYSNGEFHPEFSLLYFESVTGKWLYPFGREHPPSLLDLLKNNVIFSIKPGSSIQFTRWLGLSCKETKKKVVLFESSDLGKSMRIISSEVITLLDTSEDCKKTL